ncbi:Uncharacterized protein TCAP_04675, partial [Tolypocladium capitatum]
QRRPVYFANFSLATCLSLFGACLRSFAPSARMIDLSSIYFGLFLGIFPFTVIKVIQQSRKIIARTRSFRNDYLYMIWAEAVVNFIFAIITYLYLIDVIPGTFAFFLGTVIIWATQTQLLLQIIANRVGLIMVDQRKAMWLKLGLFGLVGCVNIAVGVIWTNGHMKTATPEQVHLNDHFEKAEKAFFLVTDLGLNLYFLYLVRFRLIALGLQKYWLLFKFNVAIVFLSTAMDALLLGMLSLSDPYLYVQFAPVVYIVKLHIELTMAALIAKIVRSRNEGHFGYPHQSTGNRRKSNTHYATFPEPRASGSTANRNDTASPSFGNDTQINKGGDESDIHLSTYPGDGGIMKTVTTIVVSENDKERGSTNSGGEEHENPRDLW